MQRSYSIPPELTRTAGGARLRVYVGLAERVNDKGECWPSLKRIAEDTGLARSTVARALTWLENFGFVTRRQRPGEGSDGMHATTVYTLPAQVREVVAANGLGDSENETRPSQNCDHGSDEDATGVVAGLRPKHFSVNSSQVKASPAKPKDVVFDLVASSIDVLGKTAPPALIVEISKRVTASGRSAHLVTRMAFWLAQQDRVDLCACSVIERSRVLGATGVIAKLTEDTTEIRRRMANCLLSKPKYPAKALADDWSRWDTTPKPTERPRSAAARQRESWDDIEAEMSNVVSIDRLAIGGAQ